MTVHHFINAVAFVVAVAGDVGIGYASWRWMLAPKIRATAREIAKREISIDRRLQPARRSNASDKCLFA